MGQLNTFLELAKGSLIAFRAIAKGNQIPFRANCMQNPRIACNGDNDSNIPLGDRNLKFTKWRQVLKFCLPSAVFIPMRACPTIPLLGRSNLVRRYLLYPCQDHLHTTVQSTSENWHLQVKRFMTYMYATFCLFQGLKRIVRGSIFQC